MSAFDDPPPGWDEVPPEDETPGKAKAAPTADFDAGILDWAALHGKPPPPRRFIWDGLVPAGEVTLLHSFGGVGKTLLAQQLATEMAPGGSLFGLAVERGVVLMIAGEDDHDEIWRRQFTICYRTGYIFNELAGRLHIAAVPHIDITIAESEESGAVQETPMLDIIRGLVKRFQPTLLILDNSAKLFAVKEGDRIAITRCVGLLRAICHDHGTTVLLIAHDNKSGAISGSTAWENSARSRLHLTRDEGGETTLATEKANYSALGAIKLRYDRGIFVPDEVAAMSEGDRIKREQDRRVHAQVFLRALDKLTAKRLTVSHKSRASNYAPREMISRALNEGLTSKQLADSMDLLIDEHRIQGDAPVYQRVNRTWACGIARTSTSEEAGTKETANDDEAEAETAE